MIEPLPPPVASVTRRGDGTQGFDRMTDPLPPGWAKTSLGEVCNIRSGNSTLIKGRMFSEPGPARVPAFSASGQDIWCEEAEHHGPGIVISAVGARCGKAFLASGSWTAIANTQVARSYGDIDIRFLWYLLNNEDFWVKGGSAQPFVKVKPSLELAVLLPPLAEQERIVAAIEEHFSRIDTAESAAQTALVRLDTLRRAILTAAFSGHLVDQDPDDEPASVLLERIAAERPQRQPRHAAQDANQGPSSVSKQLPPGWKWATVNEVSHVVLGQSPPGSTYNKVGYGSPFFQGKAEFGSFYPEVSKWTTEPKKQASAGSILVSVRAPVGPTNIAPFDCAIGRGLVALHPLGRISTEYLLWAMRHTDTMLAQQGTGSTFNAVTGAQLKAHYLPISPLAEQARIVATIEEHFSRIDAAKASLERCLQRCKVLRRAVLAAAFSGRLVEQDSSDEPASVLLERIAAGQPKRCTRSKPA